jgi:Cu(I)/Ag(I) efflux system membrane fusion protein
MKRQTIMITLAAAGIAGAGAYGLYTAGVRHGVQAAAVDTPVGKKVLYWHDPMVPGHRFDKPGKSPFMDMELVPVYVEGATDEGKVSISARVQQNLGIRTAEVTTGTLAPALEAVGSVAYNERDVALVQARSNGYVERLYVRAPLDPVRKGQALADLYVPDWVAAQEEFLSVRRMGSAPGAEGLADAARQRMRLVGMTDRQIGQVEASGKVQPRLSVTAPASGIVAELGAREGMTVMAGAPLFRINGIGTVWVNAEVPENAAAQVRPGTMAEGRTPALPGMVFKGKVGAILPEVNAATRTLKARIELANPAGQLVPGMFVTVNLAPAARKDVLLAPSEAVIRTGTRSVVMAALEGGKFEPVEVETGLEVNGQTEIRKGMKAGQKVVVSGQFLIDSEASLKGTATRMGDAAAPEGGKAPGPTHRGSGKVEKIDKDEVTLSHGPIPSLKWGPMTMGFKPPPGGLPANIAVGDAVTFEFHQAGDGMYQITTIERAADAPKAGVRK